MRFIVVFALFINSLWAHPHTFIDVFLNIIGEKNAQKIEIRWLFDEMTSSSLLMDFDANKNSQFEKEEIADFKKTVFDDLKKFSYYTHLKVAGKAIKIEPKSLDLSQEGNRFALTFKIDLEPFANQKKTIGFWDEVLMCAFELEKEHIHTSLRYTLKEVSNAYYYGYLLEL
ncbi:MAG: DUF1007 family protein [Sulfurospirillaceae bacterium]|nr:DUF1007 family protein [Sulfurospirillaceae bacterium]